MDHDYNNRKNHGGDITVSTQKTSERAILDHVRQNPKYKELVTKRSRFAWTLAFLMLLLYYSFIMVIAFAPAKLGTPIAEGSVITVGLPIGVAIIVLSFVLTGIYVRRANGEFDDLTRQLKEEAEL